MKIYLKPFSFLYDQIVNTKNAMFDRGMIQTHKVSVPVVSVGNLTVGGSGKTPITDFCIKQLVKDGKKVAVVSRAYHADAESPSWVDVDHPFGPRYYGDEPVLLAQRNPDASFFVGPSKWQTAEFAVKKDKYDVILIDDGFQHRRLQRDLNILILDATESMENYEVLPQGRARESWHNINRADVVIFSKANLAAEEDLKRLEQRVPAGKEILYFGFSLDDFRHHGGQALKHADDIRGKKVFLVSAIARPDVFEKMMGEIGEVSKASLCYRDHHQYSVNDAKKIYEEFKKSQADFLVTTEKDAVKLGHLLPELTASLWSVSLKVQELGKTGRLNEIICKVLS